MNKKMKFQMMLAERYHDMPRPLQKGKYPFILAVIIIPILHFFVFYVGINFGSIMLAFQKTQYVKGVGEVVSYTADNFKTIFNWFTQGGTKLQIALKNTFQLWIVDCLMVIPIYIIAYNFSKNMKGSKFFRVMLNLPTIISAVAYTTMVTSILQPNVGALYVLSEKYLGIKLPALLQSEQYAWTTVICYCIWSGLYANLLLIEAAIRRIPQEVVEAAKMDGAGNGGLIRYIIVPMTWGTMSTIFLIKVSQIFTITGPILLLTNGQYNTQTLNFWFYEQVAVAGEYNVSAAGGIVLTLIGIPVVWLFRKIANKISGDLEY